MCAVILETARMSNIELDPVNRLIFFPHQEQRNSKFTIYTSIYSANLDGTGKRKLYQLKTGNYFLTAMQLEPFQNRLFWMEMDIDGDLKLVSISYTGNVELEINLTDDTFDQIKDDHSVIHSVDHLVKIDGYFYVVIGSQIWKLILSKKNALESVEKLEFEKGKFELVFGKISFMKEMFDGFSGEQGKECDSAECDDICIPTREGATCHCQIGHRLDQGGKKCSPIPNTNLFFLMNTQYGEIFSYDEELHKTIAWPRVNFKVRLNLGLSNQ